MTADTDRRYASRGRPGLRRLIAAIRARMPRRRHVEWTLTYKADASAWWLVAEVATVEVVVDVYVNTTIPADEPDTALDWAHALLPNARTDIIDIDWDGSQ